MRSDQLRWWDGTAWTEHCGPRIGAATTGPMPIIRPRVSHAAPVGADSQSRYRQRRIVTRQAMPPSRTRHRRPRSLWA